MNWEYRIEVLHLYGLPSEAIVRRLNEFGVEGWEIISTLDKGGETSGVLMKRQKPNQSGSAEQLFKAIRAGENEGW
jgi:hypothetical protein